MLLPIKKCYNVFDSNRTLDQIFPTNSYKFKGGLTFVLRPEEYLESYNNDGYNIWCNLLEASVANVMGDIFFGKKLWFTILIKNVLEWQTITVHHLLMLIPMLAVEAETYCR